MLFVAALAVVLLAAPLPGEREEHAIAPEMDLESGGRSPKSLECRCVAGVLVGFGWALAQGSHALQRAHDGRPAGPDAQPSMQS